MLLVLRRFLGERDTCKNRRYSFRLGVARFVSKFKLRCRDKIGPRYLVARREPPRRVGHVNARIYLCARGYYRGPVSVRGIPTYVYLDGKHSHDYVACNAIPSALPNNQQPSRMLLPSHFCARAQRCHRYLTI